MSASTNVQKSLLHKAQATHLYGCDVIRIEDHVIRTPRLLHFKLCILENRKFINILTPHVQTVD